MAHLVAVTSQLNAKVDVLATLLACLVAPLAVDSPAATAGVAPCTQFASEDGSVAPAVIASAVLVPVVPEPVVPQSCCAPDALAVGATVWITALKSRPALNDARATVLSPLDDNGRIGVLVESSLLFRRLEARISVKPVNVRFTAFAALGFRPSG